MITKPMLSATVTGETLHTLRYPILVSPKYDGIRCIVHPKLGPVTRSFKPVPNEFIRTELRDAIPSNHGLDGELFAIGGDYEPLDFNSTQSAVMSHSGRPEFLYLVFDCFDYPDEPFYQRLNLAECITNDMADERIGVVYHSRIADVDQFMAYAAMHLQQGYEGTMIRDPEGPYKCGRSTLKQQWLVKYKEWADDEGVVIGFEELMHNANEDVKDNFGYAKRSSAKDGMVPMDTLGALVLDTRWGELRVGTGFDTAARDEIWKRNVLDPHIGIDYPEPDLGRKVTFKYQPFGMQDKPRFPVFLRFRDDE